MAQSRTDGFAQGIRGTRMYDSPGSESGLVALYHFDGSWLDEVSRSNAVAYGGATNTSVGKLGQCLQTTSAAKYVSCYNSSLLLGANAVTISLWVKASYFSQGAWIIGYFRSGNNLYMPYQNSRLYFAVTTSTSATGVEYLQGTVGAPPQDSTWHHIAMTWVRDSTFVIYYDGVSMISGDSRASHALEQLDAIQIGGDNATALKAWDGYVDEVAFYTNALSAAKVAEIYTANSNGSQINP